MAKIYGINGKITGKVGNTVFAIDGGIQVARQYNPIVANPRTEAQQSQRLKVNLAGQLSKGIIPSAIEGLKGNRRQRRSALLSNLIKDVVTKQVTATGTHVTFDAAKLRLSDGVKGINFMVSYVIGESVVMGMKQIQVTMTPGEEGSQLPVGERIRIVVVGAPDPDEHGLGGVVSAVADVVTEGGATQGLNIDIRGGEQGDPYVYAVYAIPLTLVNESVLSAGYVYGMTSGHYFVLPTSMETGGAYEYGATRFLGMKKSA